MTDSRVEPTIFPVLRIESVKLERQDKAQGLGDADNSSRQREHLGILPETSQLGRIACCNGEMRNAKCRMKKATGLAMKGQAAQYIASC
jgi:hypothetical protein